MYGRAPSASTRSAAPTPTAAPPAADTTPAQDRARPACPLVRVEVLDTLSGFSCTTLSVVQEKPDSGASMGALSTPQLIEWTGP